MTTTAEPLLPVGVLDKDGKYAFEHPDVADLITYLWTGVLLDTTKADYLRTVGVKALPASLDSKIDPLIAQYVLINGHCKQFKNVTYPKVVALASSIYNYASIAGGDEENSFYAMIIDYGNKLAAETKKKPKNQTQIDEYVNTLNELISYMQGIITDLKTDAATAKKALTDFNETCLTDQKNLRGVQGPIQTQLSGSSGEIARLTTELSTKRAELDADQKEYDQDVIIATTTLTYCWVWPFGPIIAPIVAGVYTDRAIKMKATIDAIKSLISSDNEQLATAKAIVADLTLIDANVTSIINAIGPAVQAISNLESAWQKIDDNLTNVSKNVAAISKSTIDQIRWGTANNVLTAWNTVTVAVDRYRDKAYSGAPVKMDIKGLVDTLNRAAKPA